MAAQKRLPTKVRDGLFRTPSGRDDAHEKAGVRTGLYTKAGTKKEDYAVV